MFAMRHLYICCLFCFVHCSERKRSNLIVLVAHTDDPTGNVINLLDYLHVILFFFKIRLDLKCIDY